MLNLIILTEHLMEAKLNMVQKQIIVMNLSTQ